MNMTKKININFSSLIGLKAELLRKQTEVNEAKLKTESINVLPQLNKKRSHKIIAENIETKKKMIDPDDIIAHKKSKLMLEAKTRLYEKLKKSKNNNDKFLVDFKSKTDEFDEEIIDEVICKEHPIEPEESWIEYQDCFGRTRKCLREDFSYMQQKDDLIKQEIMKMNIDDATGGESKDSAIQEKEPEIEIMRRKWEEQTQKLMDKIDIHYQDILFDEARTHGVGYYAFSQNEEERIKQQENLANLRKETEKKQREMKEIKELKDRMEQNRLKAARIRQRIRAGLSAEPTEEKLTQENKLINSVIMTDTTDVKTNNEFVKKNKEEFNEKINNKPVIIKENTASNEKIADDEDKIKAFGEVLDKKNYWHVMSQEEWIHKCRAQRINEFAPIYNNFTSAGFYDNQSIVQSPYKNNKEFEDVGKCNSQKLCKDFTNSNNLKEYDSLLYSNEPISIAKNSDNEQNDRNSLTGYNIVYKNNAKNEPSINATKSLLNSAMTLSQKQATILYPLAHLSSKYSQNIYGHSETQILRQQLLDDINIPLPGECDTTSTADENSTYISKQESLSQNINEDSIMAGLRYLREKFEESHNK